MQHGEAHGSPLNRTDWHGLALVWATVGLWPGADFSLMAPRERTDQGDLSETVPELRRSLLVWWELQGRKDPAVKPWMFFSEGDGPDPQDELDLVYP